MKFQHILISVLVISLFVTGLFTFLGNVAEYHDTDLDDSDYDEVRTVLEKQQNTSARLEYLLGGNESLDPIGSSDNPFKLIAAGWESVKLIGNSIWTARTVIYSVGNNLSETLGLPTGVVGAIFLILAVTMLIMIVFTMMKWRIED